MAFKMKGFPMIKGTKKHSAMKFGIEHKGIDSAARGTKGIGPDGKPLKMKRGGYHKGQVNDAEFEEMNDNIAMGKGPAKPKSVVSARPKPVEKGPHPDSDAHVGAVPTFSDQIGEAINNRKNNRPEPTYEGTDEFRKKKNISKSERTKRGV